MNGERIVCSSANYHGLARVIEENIHGDKLAVGEHEGEKHYFLLPSTRARLGDKSGEPITLREWETMWAAAK
ncbi:MAG: hypothetical protein ACYCYO_01910 [Bacilli bacterium]